MTYASLFFLAYQLSNGWVGYDRMAGAVHDVVEVVDEEPSLFAGDDGKAKTAALLITISFHESGWKTDALGDGGKSCGVMQTQQPQKWVAGATCDKVRADRKLGYKVGLAVLRGAKEKCGANTTAKVWLGMYASGMCGMAQVAAKKRCAPAGVCDSI